MQSKYKTHVVAMLCAVVLGCFGATRAAAQTGSDLMLAPMPPQYLLSLSADAMVLPNVDRDGSVGPSFDMYTVDSGFRLQVPFEYTGGRVIRVGHRYSYVDGDFRPGINRATDQSLAVGIEVGTWQEARIDVTIGIGYASTHAYADDDGWYGKATISYFKQLEENVDLAIVIQYDGNRSILPDIPLPGVMVRWRHSPFLVYTLGVPFSTLHWEPLDRLSIDIVYQIPFDFSGTIDYEVIDHWHIFGSVKNRRWAFHVDGGRDTLRMFLSQSRVEAGVRWKPCDYFEMFVAGGFAFGQESTVGFDVRRDEGAEIRYDDGAYIRFGGMIRY